MEKRKYNASYGSGLSSPMAQMLNENEKIFSEKRAERHKKKPPKGNSLFAWDSRKRKKRRKAALRSFQKYPFDKDLAENFWNRDKDIEDKVHSY